MMPEMIDEWEKRDTQTPIPIHIIAGCTAGLLEHVTMLPFDNIKTRLQVFNDSKLKQVVMDINRRGLRAFFTGITAASAGCMPAHALQFTVYEYSLKYLQLDNEEHHPFQFAMIGATSTFFHDACMTPFDVIKQRTQILKDLTSTQILKRMIKLEGPKSLYRSFPITFCTNGPNQAIIFSANETLKRLMSKKDDHNLLSYALSGGIAGGLATFFTNPFDVMKTKLQTQTCYVADEFQLKELIKYKNILGTFSTIKLEEGYKGFYKGLGPRFCMQVPSSAVAWGTYETVKKYLFMLTVNNRY